MLGKCVLGQRPLFIIFMVIAQFVCTAMRLKKEMQSVVVISFQIVSWFCSVSQISQLKLLYKNGFNLHST